MSRFLFLLVSLLLFGLSMYLPVVGRVPGFVLFFIGQMFSGLIFLAPAHLFFIVGCYGLACKQPRKTLRAGACATFAGIVGLTVVPIGTQGSAWQYPACWVWILSFVVLFLGGCYIARGRE